jgi:hypothetical protein
MSDMIEIRSSSARIEDGKAMERFLASIPDAAALAELLGSKEPLNTRAYDDENETARFVISDGATATCFTVTHITIDQAEMITVECEKSSAWDEVSFPEAVSRALQ